MAWVVDTAVVLDLVIADSQHGTASTTCLRRHLADGLCVCPVTLAELGPAFRGDAEAAQSFLLAVPILTVEPWTHDDSTLALRLWHEHQLRRRQLAAPKRPVADVLIAAFASRFQGIITRNAADFRNISAQLVIVEP